MSETVSTDRRAAYHEAVAKLLEGRAEEALQQLLPLRAEAEEVEVVLAIGKARLELHQGEEAAACFREVAKSSAGSSEAVRAYVQLLLAAATSLAGRREEAVQLLADVPRTDSRLEHAARALRERIEENRPPIIRF